LRDVASAIRGGQDGLPVKRLAHQDAPVAWPQQSLEQLLVSLPRKAGRQLPVLGYDQQLLGLLDLDSIVDRAALRGMFAGEARSASPPAWPQTTVAESAPLAVASPGYRAAPTERLGDGSSFLA
jgi:hypothetical protein